jgi:hypothetical protein
MPLFHGHMLGEDMRCVHCNATADMLAKADPKPDCTVKESLAAWKPIEAMTLADYERAFVNNPSLIKGTQ